MTDIEQHIRQTPLIDTHEHVLREDEYLSGAHDVLCDLFQQYVKDDLAVAGASPEALRRLTDASDPDIAGRFEAVRTAWERCRFTGYGEAAQILAKRLYGIDEITPAALRDSAEKAAAIHSPGARLRLLRDEANLDHVQIDDFRWECPPDESQPDFFLYDLSWQGFCAGCVEPAKLYDAVGVEVKDLATLREAIAGLFATWGPTAIAVKSQHAYQRTLFWEERTDAEAERVLERALTGAELTAEDRLLLGDWCTSRGAELAAEYGLPFKIHTGYCAGSGHMQMDHLRAGHLCGLVRRFPKTRFVLMHASYPYAGDLVALAKHYENVYVDLCWAWSIDSHATGEFLRRMIHAAPCHKLFAFGGDSFVPAASVAYSLQARSCLAKVMRAEVDERLITEKQAIDLATRLMLGNQRACFDIERARRRIQAARSAPLAVRRIVSE